MVCPGLIGEVMDIQLVNYFQDEVSKAMAFLVNEYSFAPPKLEIDDEIAFIKIIYMGKNLAIEFVLDEREEDIDCKVVRVLEGKKAIAYAVDEKGDRVRDSLAAILQRHGVRDRLFQRITGLSFKDSIRVTLSDFGSMLKKHGKDILCDTPDVLSG